MDVAAFLLALVPIIWLVVMLLCFKWPAWKAAIGSFVLSCLLAFAWWHLPAAQIATASLEGFLMALWPIVLVIIAAVFTYNLCVRTGAMDVIGSMITSISSDRRLLALLVAWCFGGFMEAWPASVPLSPFPPACSRAWALRPCLPCSSACWPTACPRPTAPSASPRCPLPTWWVWIPFT